MTEDRNNGENREAPQRRNASLSDDTVQETKNDILYGGGYKRPPKDTRYKKGQSGNPKGRPKNSVVGMGDSRSANALALREAERLIKVREGDEIRQMSAIEAVHRAQYGSATRENAYSQKHIIERYDRAERERRRQMIEDIELVERYVAECRKAIAEAEHKGEPPPTFLPHPDDVVIDHERGVRFIGPLNQDQVTRLEDTLKLRDVLIMQDALDRREADRPDSGDLVDGPGTAFVFADLLNRCVPGRYKLVETEFILRTMRYDAVPKRDLRRKLYRAWRTVGLQLPRGRVFPPLQFAKRFVDHIADHVASKRRFPDGLTSD